MLTKLKKLGNSQALLLPKPILEALNIQEDTPLLLSISGNVLTVTPANIGLEKGEAEKIVGSLRPEFGDMLKNLAK